MSKSIKSDNMKSEYDFTGAVRGKHHQAYKAGTNVIILDADVAEVFKDSTSVNHALRLLMQLAGKAASGAGKTTRKRSKST